MQCDLTNLKTIKALLTRHGFVFSKRLGQNFLVDPTICPRMAELAGIDGVDVLEIGPGVGVLTVELAKRAARVFSVEIDAKLFPVLEETLTLYSNVTVHHGDVLKLDLPTLLREHFGEEPIRLSVCANLPYYITSPILMYLLESHLPFESITVLVQKEVAQRICAPVGSRTSGAITAAVHYFAEPELLFTVPPCSFHPPPNVESAALQLKIRKEPSVSVTDETAFFRVIRAAFAQRRKTVLNAVSAGMNVSKAAVAAALDMANVPQNARAEQLTLEEFAQISLNL
ncbi:MAG: 16S rRNA (adenine(1518)-N(6)/adenine(1519)-N(6))-dimethyltransferase RsmA [Oscillospiraceae bacterium]|jgi:16S rRNA (adenine1518-N6/adenine1519-N6)-dimethyltransferase|nr:16S rRNA (adenine(1518)-N(6)/adenine(1519)-N(6))-dimethyltransferase RsmA [Oscillospiraceae bacterium]